MPETDYVGGLPSIEQSIERDKTDLNVVEMLVASTRSRSDPETRRRIDAFEIACSQVNIESNMKSCEHYFDILLSELIIVLFNT